MDGRFIDEKFNIWIHKEKYAHWKSTIEKAKQIAETTFNNEDDIEHYVLYEMSKNKVVFRNFPQHVWSKKDDLHGGKHMRPKFMIEMIRNFLHLRLD